MTTWPTIVLRHVRFTNLSFWRNPMAAFFTVAFPLMILILTCLMFGSAKSDVGGKSIPVASFQVIGMAVYGVVMCCFTNLATTILFDRDMGRLKRIQGTPTPASAYVAARIVFSMLVGVSTALLCVGFGVLFFGVQVTLATVVPFVLIVLFGGAALSAVALASASLIPNSQAGPAVLNGLVFPILFLSGVFFPMQNAPRWIQVVAGIFPVRHFSEAATGAFFGTGIAATDLLVIAVWGVLGAAVAARYFRWRPSR